MRYHGDGLHPWDTWCHVAPDGLVHAFYLQCVWYGPRSGDVGFLVHRGRATFADLELLALPDDVTPDVG
jgi:hypothetical protein